MLNRRQFAGVLAGSCSFPLFASGTKEKKKITFLGTTLFKHSHTQHFLDQFAIGYPMGGRWREPPLEDECLEMVADSKRLDFPFYVGSSLPVTWRLPSIDMPSGAPLKESVCVGYGGVDSYDFHALETAQCMSERRAGGEVGIRSVQAATNEKLWSMLPSKKLGRGIGGM